MTTKSLPLLVNQAQSILDEIRQHPEFKELDYHPDLMIGDACQALDELNYALQEPRNVSITTHLFESFVE